MNIFLSADIEGTAGVMHWDETEIGKSLYDHFAKQMTREVAAACCGAIDAGATSLCVKDAHDGGRNIDPDALPDCARIVRGSARSPMCMMAGLDKTFDGVLFTGYHAAAGMDDNPLAHTMSTAILDVKINGRVAPEFYINALTAAYLGVPVYFVSGDIGICEYARSLNPNIRTVAVSEGIGAASRSIHPGLAARKIRETIAEALRQPREDFLFPMPETFDVEITYRQHFDAKRAGFYPGAAQTAPRSVAYHADNYWDILTFFLFVL